MLLLCRLTRRSGIGACKEVGHKMDFIVGGLAGAGATIITNPMDVVKTRLQLQGELRVLERGSARYRGMLHALYLIARTDGALALQSGLAPAMLLGFSMNSVRLGLYHISEVNGWTHTAEGTVSIHKAMFWSCVAGAASGVAANPASVVKTRIQAAAHPSIAVGRQHRYKGTLDAFSTIYRTEGVRGYFAGLTATCSRLAVGSAAQLTTFSTVKEYLWQRGYTHSPLMQSFLASLACSVLVVAVETPLDVVNTRLMNQGSEKTQGGLLYNGVIDCLRKIYRTEGLYGLYKGVGPLYLRIAPHTTLSLVIWDMLNNILAKDS
ncbi:solute carrier family 25 member 35 isoform X2 [Plutella xylostella]|uniref:solute carrier family 25 member 35 isoform X2 n=1 Tax=Plutella xylostella TaxID=51655 RepID=UPI00203290BC|nr:solute carrier family 25 member 35 isoform X2 [Plutella xylostella]